MLRLANALHACAALARRAQGPGGKGLIVKTASGRAIDTDMTMLVIGEQEGASLHAKAR